MMGFYSELEGLNISVEGVEIETREKQVSENFTRKTSVVKLNGDGETGKGEDVIYEAEKHEFPDLDLKGDYSFGEFSEKLGETQLFPDSVETTETDENYRRWALESAALDLALKQKDLSLAEALGMEYSPVRFVVSPSLDGVSDDKLVKLGMMVPGIEFKLDASGEWSEKFVEKLARKKNVRVVDLKGLYEKEGVRMAPNPEVYRLVAEKLDALIEDPKLTEDTEEVLEEHKERITWDVPITGVGSIEELPFLPKILNIKPSRFGTVKSLFETIGYCQENGIDMYGGGQFELGVGREHIHSFASLFYPDSPNDVAPRVYNQEKVPEDPPKSPLTPQKNLRGLDWRYAE
jgi:hypothetical protein